ncbi:hypothetical protein [Paractinoplanes hotanensis]|uniref:Uncharacterized protein n=1 Tax=Paractinoplanes hotanensis TaxID=2906497 RepID=A0ABT0YC43_9ACTN|nr:hypothetical protein [Actinoplanes hotanensis]MCM4083622.1 hypothetical protein [Actinoplanes hotanensis]
MTSRSTRSARPAQGGLQSGEALEFGVSRDIREGRGDQLGELAEADLRLFRQACQGVPGYLLCPRANTLTVTAVE